ncbi:hypothetical protein LCM00_04660 [Bacillus infantis]|uniref:hypothetical protein n=1 Tax=Bacillus infantis TaxID=324767 RepID=UPI001CD1F7C1|nr:hypothetical protein [Bacillus infantis]MCA1038792.1 hypothetical protein [Bacillus infantis]
MKLRETKKEKQIRLFLALAFAGVALAAIYFQYLKPAGGTGSPLALVIKAGSADGADPLVVLYDEKKQDHVLALYEVEKDNDFKFRLIKSATLESAPEKMAVDREGAGFWAEVDGDWVYLDPDLKVRARKPRLRGTITSDGEPFKVRKTSNHTVLEAEGQYEVAFNEAGRPESVHALTADHSSWLILLEDGVRIASGRTL